MYDVFRLHGKALTLLRIQNGMKVGELAKKLGVTSQHISQCESSKRKLTESMTKEFLTLISTTEEEAKTFVDIIESK